MPAKTIKVIKNISTIENLCRLYFSKNLNSKIFNIIFTKGIINPNKIIIVDNGMGFTKKEDLSEILNPYFTTKKNGTGLGLSIVSKIINDHNGNIDFIALNDGAEIKINFNK